MKSRIKEIRIFKGLTQTEFADIIGVSQNSIANYESGNRNPREAVLKSICREFNVNPLWLETGEGDMFFHQSDDDLFGLVARVFPNCSEFERSAFRWLLSKPPEWWQEAEDVAQKILDDAKRKKGGQP